MGIPEEPDFMSRAEEEEQDGQPGPSTGKTRPRSGDEGGSMGETETSSEEGSSNNINDNNSKSNKGKQAMKRMKVSSGPSQSY